MSKDNDLFNNFVAASADPCPNHNETSNGSVELGKFFFPPSDMIISTDS